MLSFVLPTRDRPHSLTRTLEALGGLDVSAEVIVIDNAPRLPARTPTTLANGTPVRVLRSATNLGAAARNLGARESDPASTWLVMLDDDSHPLDSAFVRALHEQPTDVVAVSADISLPAQNRREDGGLPEVFIGCGVAIRRDAFLTLGGYDATFNYYAEEYDLAARIILAGARTVFDPRFRVAHHKENLHRDFNRIIARLVRNNGWVAQRYTPESQRREELRRLRRRYRSIAMKEDARDGFGSGLLELRTSLRNQRRTPMPTPLFDRFTGLTHAREALSAAFTQSHFRSAAIVDEGKNGWAVARALKELGVRDAGIDSADVLVIGTLSPGPMIDAAMRRAAENRRVLSPWVMAQRFAADAATAPIEHEQRLRAVPQHAVAPARHLRAG